MITILRVSDDEFLAVDDESRDPLGVMRRTNSKDACTPEYHWSVEDAEGKVAAEGTTTDYADGCWKMALMAEKVSEDLPIDNRDTEAISA